MGAFQAATLLAGWSWVSPASAEKIACVGDSITFGYGLSNPSTESYPAVLQTLLGTAHTVQNFGVSGCTLLKNGDRPYWDESAFAASDAFAPDVVVVMLGTNDAKPQNWSHKAEFSSDYHDLVDHYRALGALVYVAAPPPVYDPGAFDISPQVVSSEVAPLVVQIASEVNAPLIDVFQALSGRPANFPDTVHPNAEGARLIAETVEAALRQNGFGGATGGGGSGSGGDGGQDGGAGGGITAGAASTGLGGSTGSGGGSQSEGEGGSAASGGSDASGSSGPTSDGGFPASGGSSAIGGAAAGGAAHSGGTIATVTGGSGAGGSATTSGASHSGGTATATGGSATASGASHSGGAATATGGSAAASGGSNTSGGAAAAGGSHAGGVTAQTGGDSFDDEATATGGGPDVTGGALPSSGATPASGGTASGAPSESAPSADEEGCGCRLGAGTRPSGPGLAWLLLAWVPMMWRRRAQSPKRVEL